MIFLIVCFLLFYIALSETGNKIHKKKYRVELLRVTPDENTAKYIKECQISVEYTADGLITLNGSLFFAVDPPNDTKIEVSGFQKNLDGKSWQILPSLNYKSTLCDLLMKDYTFIVHELLEGSNLVRKCPAKKGLYTLNNVKIGRNWPLSIAGNSWLLRYTVILDKRRKFQVDADIFFDSRAQAPIPTLLGPASMLG